jgi:hypothetical protein
VKVRPPHLRLVRPVDRRVHRPPQAPGLHLPGAMPRTGGVVVKILTLNPVSPTLAAEIPLTVIPVGWKPQVRCEACGGKGVIASAGKGVIASVYHQCSACEGRGTTDYRGRLGLSDGEHLHLSCALVDVVPIYSADHRTEAWERHVAPTSQGDLWLWKGPSEHENLSTGRPVWLHDDITAQRPYSDFSPTGPCPYCGSPPGPPHHVYGERKCCPDCRHPQRYALVIEDVKATTERCPRCWGECVERGPEQERWELPEAVCSVCSGRGVCPPVPMPGHPDRLTEATW